MKPDGSTGVNIKAPAGAKRNMRRGTGCDCGCVSEAANVKTKCMCLANHKITQISTRKYEEVRYIKLTNFLCLIP